MLPFEPRYPERRAGRGGHSGRALGPGLSLGRGLRAVPLKQAGRDPAVDAAHSLNARTQDSGGRGVRRGQRSPQNLLLPLLHSVEEALQLPGPLAVHEALADAGVQAPGELRAGGEDTVRAGPPRGSPRAHRAGVLEDRTSEVCSKRGPSQPRRLLRRLALSHTPRRAQSPVGEQARSNRRLRLSPHTGK